MPNCPVCAEKAIMPTGNKSSSVLLVGDAPSEKDIQYGKPFSGPAGKIFRKEWMRVIEQDLLMFRLCNLWIHAENKDENCFNVGKDIVLDESEDRAVIVLLGSETVSYFTGYKVSDVSGLVVPSEYFQDKIVFCMVSPGILFQKGVGEVRFALHNLKQELDKAGAL